MRIRIILFIIFSGCSEISKIGNAPDFTDDAGSHQYNAIYSQGSATPSLTDNTLTSSCSGVQTSLRYLEIDEPVHEEIF